MICTIYSHQIGFDKITVILKESYPTASLTISTQQESQIATLEIKGGFFSTSSVLKIRYRQRKEPSYQIPEIDDCLLTTNLKGLYGFVNSMPANNPKVKDLFLRKIETLNCEFSIKQEHGKTKDLHALILKFAQEFEAIIFAQPSTVISKSEIGQHFLDTNLNLIIDEQGNCAIETLAVKIDSIYFDGENKEGTDDQKVRKTRSEAILEEKDIKTNKNLPFIISEQKVTIRQPKEIAIRVSILAMTNLVAFNHVSSDIAIEYLKKYNLWNATTDNEKNFLENPTDELKTIETWKCEGIWTLLWALGKIDALGFPNELCNLDLIPKDKYPIGQAKNPNDFINSITVTRDKAEILDANDMYYRFDWACVDARLQNETITEINPSVIYERHYALNWLINYRGQDWDDVSCDT
ncbi:hypothetical protein GCM10022393_22700 [Aquimarina addita]|uniref:DUF4272 domain-containing protein n=1 Tax=Aquimarina addita TaxID=870485 RepID=A0ABP6UMA9_9FLAO